MTKAKPGGYTMNAEVVRAKNAIRAAQLAARRLLNENPSPTLQALLIAKTISEMSEAIDALDEIQKVTKGAQE